MQPESIVGRVRHIGPGSAFWLGLLFAIVASIMMTIVLVLAWLGLDYFGVIQSVNTAMEDLIKFQVTIVHVLWAALALAVFFIVSLPIISALMAVVYNLSAAITGGLKATMKEEISDTTD